MKSKGLAFIMGLGLLWVCSDAIQSDDSGVKGKPQATAVKTRPISSYKPNEKVNKTPAEWRSLLTRAQFRILREKGTERPWTGKHNKNKKEGVFTCAGCGHPLFKSSTKFESGTGWPSFHSPYLKENVKNVVDNTYGMRRVEIVCNRCGGHLGHVFHDGPAPTGLRYCVNSLSLNFKPK